MGLLTEIIDGFMAGLAESGSDTADVNPASGLETDGGLDAMGDAVGFDTFSDPFDCFPDTYDMGSFDSSMDDSMSCSFDDDFGLGSDW